MEQAEGPQCWQGWVGACQAAQEARRHESASLCILGLACRPLWASQPPPALPCQEQGEVSPAGRASGNGPLWSRHGRWLGLRLTSIPPIRPSPYHKPHLPSGPKPLSQAATLWEECLLPLSAPFPMAGRGGRGCPAVGGVLRVRAGCAWGAPGLAGPGSEPPDPRHLPGAESGLVSRSLKGSGPLCTRRVTIRVPVGSPSSPEQGPPVPT